MHFTQQHLADYLAFSTRRMLATISYDQDGSASLNSEEESIRWRSLSSALLAPIWRDLDQWAVSYVSKQWDTLTGDYSLAVVNLMLPRDYVEESDFDQAAEEVRQLCSGGQLIHRYVENEAGDIELQIDTASVLLHRSGVVDPRLAFGACLKDKRTAKEKEVITS